MNDFLDALVQMLRALFSGVVSGFATSSVTATVKELLDTDSLGILEYPCPPSIYRPVLSTTRKSLRGSKVNDPVPAEAKS